MANTKITTAVIKDDAITTAKIADDAVTGALIADDVALAGNPTTTTQSAGNNTTRIATTAFVTTAINNLVDSAPSALDTLNELAAAMGDDANFSTTVTNSIATKLPLAGGTLTGALTVTADANPSLEVSRGSANTTNVNLKYNTTLTGQLSAADEKFQISAAGSGTEMEFYTAGQRALVINTSGNVGIGQENPDQKLVVEHDGDSQIKIVSGASNDAYLSFFNGTTLKHYFKQDNTGLFELYYYDGSAANSRIALDTSGNLALGHTTTSGAKFMVSNGGAASFQFYPEISTDTNLTQHYDLAASAYMHAETRASSHSFKIGTTEHMKVETGGDTVITGPNSATFQVRAPTDNAFVAIYGGYNDSGAEAAGVLLYQNQTAKWQIANTTSNIFRIYSYAVSADVLQIDTNGVTQLGDGGGHSDLLRLKNSYAADSTQRGAISWEDNSATTAQIDTRYDGARVNMHFSHLYKSGYQTGNAAILGGLGTWGVGTDSPRTDMRFTSGTAVSTKRWGFGGGIAGTNDVYYIINESNVGQYMAHGAQAWTVHSDERIKENIVDVGAVLPSLMTMRCVKYNLISNPGDTKIGFIAQDWESSFPEVIDENDHLVLEDDGTIGTNDESDSTTPVKAMAYTETIPLLLKAIQEQQAQIEALQSKVEALENG